MKGDVSLVLLVDAGGFWYAARLQTARGDTPAKSETSFSGGEAVLHN